MKSTIISMFIVLFVMIAVPLVFLGEDNLADQFGFGIGSSGPTASVPAKLPTNVKAVTTRTKVEVYTWVDENGVTQFSQTPHSEGLTSVKMVLNPNTNIMDALKVPEEAEVAEGPTIFSLGKNKNPYTPGGVKDLVDDTSGIKESMAQQQEDREKMMQELFPQQNKKK